MYVKRSKGGALSMVCPGPRPPSLKADGSIMHSATTLLMGLSLCGTGSVYLGLLLHGMTTFILIQLSITKLSKGVSLVM